MSALCKLGIHKWGRWDWWPFSAFKLGQARWCVRCRQIQTRSIGQ